MTDVDPDNGAVGTTALTVSGTGFIDNAWLGCVFSDSPLAVVPASFSSATRLACSYTAAAPFGTVSVAVTTNGQESSAVTRTLTHRAPPVLTSLSPDNGPAGATTVTISGTGFVATDWLQCRWDGAGAATPQVDATFVSSTEITCVFTGEQRGAT